MPLTQKFKETVQSRLRGDRKDRKELPREESNAFSPAISVTESESARLHQRDDRVREPKSPDPNDLRKA